MRIYQWFLISWIVFLFSLGVVSPSSAKEELPAIVKKIEPSVVVILTYDKEGKVIGQGSGFFISENGDVITNRHVLEGATTATVKTIDGKVYTVTMVLAEDKKGDLIRVLVDIPPNVVHPLTLSTSLPEVGERVIVIGSPLGLEQTVSDGIVSAVREVPGFGNIVQITAPISQGSSGSPVVNMDGRVIGIATIQIIEGQNLNFAIPGERIARLVPGKGKTLAKWERMERLDKYLTTPRPDVEARLSPNGKKEDYEKYIQRLQEEIRINPDFAVWHLGLGAAYYMLGRWNEAIEAYKQAIRIKPDYADAYDGLGWAYYELGSYEEAIKAHKQVIRIKPDFAEAHCNLGVVYGGLGRWNEAIEAFKLAIRIEPDYAEAHHGLGGAYFELERWNEAIEAFKQAIRIKPDYAEAHYNLSLTYLILGDKSSALDGYKILKDLDKDLANKLFNLIYK